MTRVLLVTHFYPAHGGGVERVAGELARRLAALGVAITWCASDVDAPPAIPGVHCEPMRTSNLVERLSGLPYPLWSPASLRRLAALVRDSDALHLHDGIYLGSWVAALLARRQRRRWVVTQHIGAVPLRAPWRWLYDAANRAAARWVLRPAHAVGFISPEGLRHFVAMGAPQPHFRYLPNGVDTALFHPAPAPPRAAHGLAEGRPLLLFVGRFVPVKRLGVIRAMAAARPDWQWCLIGQGPEDPARWGLQNVITPGPLPQPALADWYRMADLLLLPSHSEGFALVVQEAMACGTPACFSDRVAAGSTVPPDLFVRLPAADGADDAQVARDGLAGIERWLAAPAAQRAAQRSACAAFAQRAWRWDDLAHTYLGWLQGVPP